MASRRITSVLAEPAEDSVPMVLVVEPQQKTSMSLLCLNEEKEIERAVAIRPIVEYVGIMPLKGCQHVEGVC